MSQSFSDKLIEKDLSLLNDIQLDELYILCDMYAKVRPRLEAQANGKYAAEQIKPAVDFLRKVLHLEDEPKRNPSCKDKNDKSVRIEQLNKIMGSDKAKYIDTLREISYCFFEICNDSTLLTNRNLIDTKEIKIYRRISESIETIYKTIREIYLRCDKKSILKRYVLNENGI